QMAVQHRDVAAAPAKGVNRLRRQADFGDEDERDLALADDFLDGAEIELCLAATGDAVEEERAKTAVPEDGFENRPDAGLLGRQSVARSLRQRNRLAERVGHTGRLRYRGGRLHSPRFA